MHGKLEDLRLLHVAHQLEQTFEGLERTFESRLQTPRLREIIEPLFGGGPSHDKLEWALRELEAEVKAAESKVTERNLLMAILACEKMAKDFYIRRLDDLSDAKLVELFRELANEESRHIEAVERALALAK